MAELPNVNGVVSSYNDEDDDQTVKILKSAEQEEESKISQLEDKIELLEEEKSELKTENEQKLEKIKLLTNEIQGLKTNQVMLNQKIAEMKSQIDQSEEDKRTLQAIALRASDLETELSRLQHDHISSLSEKEEIVAELKSEVEELKQRNLNKEERIEELEKEKAILVREAEEAKKLKAESEVTVRDLQAKIIVAEAGLGKISEGEAEIVVLKKAKIEAEAGISSVEEALKQSEKKLEETEKKVNELESELEELKKVSEKKVVMNGNGTARSVDTPTGLKSVKVQWPVAALASTGVIAVAVAVVYYSRRRAVGLIYYILILCRFY